jgi:small subunit ribosomal protein S16
MLAIRLQRTGRKGHAQFRILVQDARRTPTSGRFVAHLGSYDPHTKTIILDKEKAALYLKNGARPSDRVASLLQKEGIKLPSWVKLETKKLRETRKPEKLRKNQPKQEVVAEEASVTEEAVAEPAVEEPIVEQEAPAEDAPVAEVSEATKEVTKA